MPPVRRCNAKSDAGSDPVDSLSALEDISEDGRKIVEAIKGIVQELRNDFAVMMKEKDREISELKNGVGCLQARVSKLEERIEDAEAYER